MDASDGFFARIVFKYLVAETDSFESERYYETRVPIIRTGQISNLLSSLPLKIFAFQRTVYVINVSITNAFPSESVETPIQHKSCKYNMAYG